MTPERWQRVEEIFYAAVEREPAERMGFLDEACAGDSGYYERFFRLRLPPAR